MVAGAGGGGEVAGQDAHGGRLAGAVGAEEADDLAGRHVEGHVADGGVVAVVLGQVADVDHGQPPVSTWKLWDALNIANAAPAGKGWGRYVTDAARRPRVCDTMDATRSCATSSSPSATTARDFIGWQTQPGLRTVQETLEAAIAKLTGEERVRVNASGRTDAGVHAVGQVVNFFSDDQHPAGRAGAGHQCPSAGRRGRSATPTRCRKRSTPTATPSASSIAT